ncbi:restriction endonuclease subunit S [Lacrimispora sp.]|uniref:restriction endonuclease subunit S n=1 Tax=Lacrimispora sp. TaxID=2719234 RepID=UPI0028A907C3|nr:restriction endonuclease subunit S [Lacrimispora sp.]
MSRIGLSSDILPVGCSLCATYCWISSFITFMLNRTTLNASTSCISLTDLLKKKTLPETDFPFIYIQSCIENPIKPLVVNILCKIYAWEQRKLGAVYRNIRNAFVGTATPYYVESEEDGYFYLESNNIKEGQINRNAEVFINEAFYQGQRDKWLHTGDLVMVQSGHVGHTAVIPKELDCVAAHALIMFQNSIDNINPYFTNYQLQTLESKKKLDYITTGNTIKHILASEMKQFTVDFSATIEEQTAISNFFLTLDDAITLHKRKLDGLKELKRGYLQRMFPQAGENVPQVRFSRFTSDWERTTIGKISDIVRGASPRPIQNPKWFDKNSDVGWLRISDVTEQNGRINHLEQKISQAGQSKTRVLRTPHLLFSIAATVGKPVINYIKTGVHDGFLIFLNPKFEQEFMFQWLEMFRPQWQQYGQPGSQVNLNSELVKAQEVYLPANEEQTAIGDFFRNLDVQISVQQQKLSQLKRLKSTYLQKMFI